MTTLDYKDFSYVELKYTFKEILRKDLVLFLNQTRPVFFTLKLSNYQLACFKVTSTEVLDSHGFPELKGELTMYKNFDIPLSKGEDKSDRLHFTTFELSNVESLADSVLELLVHIDNTAKSNQVHNNLLQFDSETNGDLLEKVISTALLYQSSFKFIYNGDIHIATRNIQSYSPKLDKLEYDLNITLTNTRINDIEIFSNISHLVDYLQN